MMLFENKVCDEFEFWTWRANLASSSLFNLISFDIKKFCLKKFSSVFYYEIKNLINRGQKTFDKKIVKQYLIHWKNYEFEYDEWKFIIKLIDFLKLIEQYEIEYSLNTFINELKIDRKTFNQILILRKSIAFIFINCSISVIINQTLTLKKFIDATNFVSRNTISFRRRDRLKKKMKKWRNNIDFFLLTRNKKTAWNLLKNIHK